MAIKDKKKNLVFIYGYLASILMLTVINTYLPIFYLNILGIPKAEVANVLFLALTTQFIKPVISIYFDKKPKKTKNFALIGSLCLIISFALLVFNLASLILFGIFLSTTFGFIFLVDVTIDKYIVAISLDDETREKNAYYTQIGAIMGSILGVLLFMILVSSKAIGTWNQYFVIIIIFAVPVIPIIFLLKKIGEETEIKEVELGKNVIQEMKSIPIILMCIFLFLYSGDYLYDWVVESWILSKYGSGGIGLFSTFLIGWILIQTIGMILGRILSERLNKKPIIIYSLIAIGVIFIIGPYMGLMTMLILFTIMNFLSGFILIFILAIMLDLSEKKVLLFQYMSIYVIIARISLTPLGLLLYDYLPGESILTIAGILFTLSALPMYLLLKRIDK
jgi:MFS family permease